MKIYVIGSTHEIERTRAIMAALREAGHEITHDWTVNVERLGATPQDEDQALADARADAAGIRAAEHVVFLVSPDRPQRGGHVEMGIALGAKIPVTLSYPKLLRCGEPPDTWPAMRTVFDAAADITSDVVLVDYLASVIADDECGQFVRESFTETAL